MSDIFGPALTPEEVRANLLSVTQAEDAKRDSAEASRIELRDLTDELIDWCEDAAAYLFSAGQHGAFDVPRVTVLIQHGETALLNFKNCPGPRSTEHEDQHKWFMARTAQANTLMNLAALL